VLGHDLARARPAVSGHGLIRSTTTAYDRNGAWAELLVVTWFAWLNRASDSQP
jgi:hypothetical protein